MPLFLRHPKTLMYLSNVATKPSMGLPCLPIGIDPHWAKFRHRLLFGDLKIWMTFQGSATILKEGQKAHESRKEVEFWGTLPSRQDLAFLLNPP